MILALAATLALALIGVGLCFWSVTSRHKWAEFPVFMTGLVVLVFAAILLVVFAARAPAWISAGYKADIINREYGTTYSQAEMFFAGEVIDVVRELDRKRYQVTVGTP